MAGFLTFFGILFLIASILMLGPIRNDTHLQIIVISWAAGWVIIGIAAVIRRLDQLAVGLRSGHSLAGQLAIATGQPLEYRTEEGDARPLLDQHVFVRRHKPPFSNQLKWQAVIHGTSRNFDTEDEALAHIRQYRQTNRLSARS